MQKGIQVRMQKFQFSVAAEAEQGWGKSKSEESQITTDLESKINTAFCKVSSTCLPPWFLDAAIEPQSEQFNSNNKTSVKKHPYKHANN